MRLLLRCPNLIVISAAMSVVLSPSLAARETISLFNTNDLTGWTVHGTELWYVEDGDLVCESGPDAAYGYLATEASFEDFELTLDFLQEADGNSGVFIRSPVEGTRVSGWQAEVAPPGKHTGGHCGRAYRSADSRRWRYQSAVAEPACGGPLK